MPFDDIRLETIQYIDILKGGAISSGVNVGRKERGLPHDRDTKLVNSTLIFGVNKNRYLFYNVALSNANVRCGAQRGTELSPRYP